MTLVQGSMYKDQCIQYRFSKAAALQQHLIILEAHITLYFTDHIYIVKAVIHSLDRWDISQNQKADKCR